MARLRPVVLAFAVSVVVAGALPSLAQGAYPGRNGVVALVSAGSGNDSYSAQLSLFDTQTHSSWDLTSCTVLSQGQHLGETCPADPSFSPKGTRLAHGAEGRIAIADPHGYFATRTLPALTESDGDPSWSPSGRRLVFTGRRAGGSNLYVVNRNGTGLERLTRSGGREPAWSRRNRIAYVRAGVIHVLNPASGHVIRLARGSHPDFAPSGRSLVFERKGRVYLIRARRGARRKLLRRDALEPAVSPDGRSLVFIRPTDGVFTASMRGGAAKSIAASSGDFSVHDLAWQPVVGPRAARCARRDSRCRRARRCRLMRGNTVLRTRKVRVVSRLNRDSSYDLVGCAFSTGRRRVLFRGVGFDTSASSAEITRTAGTYVAIRESYGDQYRSTWSVRVVDLANGGSYEPFDQTHGVQTSRNEDLTLVRYFLNRFGEFAASFERYPLDSRGVPAEQPTQTLIVRFSSKGERFELDSDTPAALPAASLGMDGHRVTWLHNGQVHSDPPSS